MDARPIASPDFAGLPDPFLRVALAEDAEELGEAVEEGGRHPGL